MQGFDLAADPEKFPEQLQYSQVWQPKRLLINTGWWWNPDISVDDPGVIGVDVGGYSPLLGSSFTEIAALSRSQHKSQGFGATGSRGEQIEFLEIAAGEEPEMELFEDIDLSWDRVEGGKKMEPMIDKLVKEYDPEHPYASIPGLLNIRKHILTLDDAFWKEKKLEEVDELLKACMGLFLGSQSTGLCFNPGRQPED